MGQTANDYVKSLFESIDTIINVRLDSISYDTTIICTVVDDSDRKNGEYKVTDGSIPYLVYSDVDTYRKGDQVRVTVPMGDYTQQKFITGKYTKDNKSNPITYVSPVDSVMNISGNLLENVSGGIVANGQDRVRVLWNRTLDESFAIMQDNDVYNTIILKAEFRTLLSNYDLIEGNYGLQLDFLVEPSANSGVNIRRTVQLDSSEMFGNPYHFAINSSQAKVIKLNTIGIIKAIELSLYQNGNFKDRNSGIITPLVDYDNIFVDNIVLGLGCDLSDIKDNQLQVYTENDVQYHYHNHNNSTNLKTMGLLWLNKDDNNQYIGFSDGIFDPNYDEFVYLKESKMDTRLIAQQGKKGIPQDRTSLEQIGRAHV